MRDIEGMMTLGQLIRSSSKVTSLHGIQNYGMDDIFKKSFGHIYYSDKVAYYNEEYKILEIRVVFGSYTTDYSDVHVVRMAFYGVEGKVLDSVQTLYDEYNYDNNKRGRRATRLSTMTRNERIEGDLFDGIIIPCAQTKYSSDKLGYAQSDRVFYSKTGITMSTKCAVSCTCPSYKYTFANANWKNNVHLGQKPYTYGKKPVKYTKKSKRWVKHGNNVITKNGEASVYMEVNNSNVNKFVLNVDQNAGLCKHLMMAALLLLDGGILKNTGRSRIRKLDLNRLEKTIKRDKDISSVNKKNPGSNTVEKKYLDGVTNAIELSKKDAIKKEINEVKEMKKVVDPETGEVTNIYKYYQAVGTPDEKDLNETLYLLASMSENDNDLKKFINKSINRKKLYDLNKLKNNKGFS